MRLCRLPAAKGEQAQYHQKREHGPEPTAAYRHIWLPQTDVPTKSGSHSCRIKNGILTKVKAANPDVFVAASIRLDDLVAITRQLREADLNAKMVSSLPYGLLPEYYQKLGKDAEFVYSASFWEATLPNPGNQEFVAAYRQEYNRAPAVQSANSYAGCQILVEAIQRAGTIDSDKLREDLLGLKTKTVLGDFAVDERGFQVGQKAVTIQWQDGQQAVVWPDELSSGRLRFPTPSWNWR